MHKLAKIGELMWQKKQGTTDLYSKIPIRIRKVLDNVISSIQWERISDGCMQQDQNSLDQAKEAYQFFIGKADEIISVQNPSRLTENDLYLMADKNNIKNEFKDDAARFVFEMATCLKKERELIFTYQGTVNTNSEIRDNHAGVANQLDDIDLKNIEQFIQAANNFLQQALKHMEDTEKYSNSARVLCITLECDIAGIGLESTGLTLEQIRNCDLAEAESCDLSAKNSKDQAAECKEKALEALQSACYFSKHYVKKLSEFLNAWKTAETLWSVEVGAQPDTGSLINKYKRFGTIIRTVLLWFSDTGILQEIRNKEQVQSPIQMNAFSVTVVNIQLEFQRIMCIMTPIVVNQPKGQISIQNNGSKKTPNFCTKKTQHFTTSVRILALECFETFCFTKKEIELVAERELEQTSTATASRSNSRPCLNVETSTGSIPTEVKFKVVVNNFSRDEQNNVYKQFFRFRYKICVNIDGTDYNMEVLSLPFTFNTGANQTLEHIGSRFWYLMSAKDMYNGSFKCLDPLPVETVIQMLDDRIACLGNRPRRLTDAEKLFLRGRLPVLSDETVSMQGFLKDKMKALRSEKSLSHSFYTWFYAVIHGIEQLFLKAWEDGIIYGFCCNEQAKVLLLKEDIPEGTLVLRPNVSIVNKTSSTEATAGLTIEVKVRNKNGDGPEYIVQSLPLLYEDIEQSTLFDIISGSDYENLAKTSIKPVYKFIYGKERRLEISVLKKYAKKPEQKMLHEYSLLIQRINHIKFKECSVAESASADVSSGEDDSEQIPTKIKRKSAKPSAKRKSQESTTKTQLKSTATAQNPRSGLEDQIMHGLSDQTNSTRANSKPTHQLFGDHIVDVSQIINNTNPTSDLANSDQKDQSPTETVLVDYDEITDFIAPNSVQSRSFFNQLDSQHADTGIRYYGESSRSSHSSTIYNGSDVCSPVQISENSLQSPPSASSSCSESSHCILHLSDQANLPLILDDACELKSQSRKRGKSKESRVSYRKKKPQPSQIPAVEVQLLGQNDESDMLAQIPMLSGFNFQMLEKSLFDESVQLNISDITNLLNYQDEEQI